MTRSDGRGEQCTSDLSLDLLLAGDLPAARAAALRLHLGACPACAARYAVVRAGFDAWQDRSSSRTAAIGRAAPRSRVRPRLWLAGAIACAAAIVLLLRPPSGTEAPARGTRIKGDIHLTLYIKHGTQIRPAGPAEVAFPGDQLQVTYTARRAGHVAMLGFDAAGVASVYFPDDRAHAWPAAPGTDVSLPRSTILDDVPGQEVIWVLHCPQPFEIEPLRLALAAHPRSFASPSDCHGERFVLDKEIAR